MLPVFSLSLSFRPLNSSSPILTFALAKDFETSCLAVHTECVLAPASIQALPPLHVHPGSCEQRSSLAMLCLSVTLSFLGCELLEDGSLQLALIAAIMDRNPWIQKQELTAWEGREGSTDLCPGQRGGLESEALTGLKLLPGQCGD